MLVVENPDVIETSECGVPSFTKKMILILLVSLCISGASSPFNPDYPASIDVLVAYGECQQKLFGLLANVPETQRIFNSLNKKVVVRFCSCTIDNVLKQVSDYGDATVDLTKVTLALIKSTRHNQECRKVGLEGKSNKLLTESFQPSFFDTSRLGTLHLFHSFTGCSGSTSKLNGRIKLCACLTDAIVEVFRKYGRIPAKQALEKTLKRTGYTVPPITWTYSERAKQLVLQSDGRRAENELFQFVNRCKSLLE